MFFKKKIRQNLFEGSEKKLEVILDSKSKSLREYPSSFFQSLVEKSKAQIISQSSNAHCDSYILSESSLFVWDHRLIMITCGKSLLSSSVLFLLKSFKKKYIKALFFQRKNEFFPFDQRTNFERDAGRLKKKMKNNIYQFGTLDEHHFFLLHLDQPYQPSHQDRTVEVLIYDLRGDLSQLFNSKATAEEIRQNLNLNQCFPSFSIYDYVFEPKGYSLNALRGHEYFTIHVTPQKVGFYVSFETNMDEDPSHIVQKIVLLFKPQSFDVIASFPTKSFLSINYDSYVESNYYKNSHYRASLNCGFDIEYLTFKTAHSKPLFPVKWDIT